MPAEAPGTPPHAPVPSASAPALPAPAPAVPAPLLRPSTCRSQPRARTRPGTTPTMGGLAPPTSPGPRASPMWEWLRRHHIFLGQPGRSLLVVEDPRHRHHQALDPSSSPPRPLVVTRHHSTTATLSRTVTLLHARLSRSHWPSTGASMPEMRWRAIRSSQPHPCHHPLQRSWLLLQPPQWLRSWPGAPHHRRPRQQPWRPSGLLLHRGGRIPRWRGTG